MQELEEEIIEEYKSSSSVGIGSCLTLLLAELLVWTSFNVRFVFPFPVDG